MIEMFSQYNCNLVSTKDNIDFGTANGRFFVGMLALVAQWERETIQERTLDGLEDIVREGKWPYEKKPYGYNKNKELKLSYNSEEVKHVEFINQKAIEGVTIKEIERLLIDEFAVTLDAEKIKEIIMRDWYHGEFLFRGTIYTGVFPPIYSKESALEARKIVSKRFKTYEDNRYYYGNKVKCVCGEILQHKSTKKRSGKSYYYYLCPNCKKRMNQNHLVEQTLYAISAETSLIETKSNTNRALQKLYRINAKIQKIHDRYIGDSINFQSYVMAIYKLEYEKKEQIAKIKTSKLIDFLRWEEMERTERRHFIHNHIKDIVVDTKMNIVIKIDYISKNTNITSK